MEACKDLTKPLMKPLNLLPAGVLILEKCDKYLLEVSVDSNLVKDLAALVAELSGLGIITIEILSQPNGYSQDGPLKSWQSAAGAYLMIVTKASDRFKAKEATSIERMAQTFDQLRKTIVDHQRECFRVQVCDVVNWAIFNMDSKEITIDAVTAIISLKAKAALLSNDANFLAALDHQTEIVKAHKGDIDSRTAFLDGVQLVFTTMLNAKLEASPKTKKDKFEVSRFPDLIQVLGFLDNCNKMQENEGATLKQTFGMAKLLDATVDVGLRLANETAIRDMARFCAYQRSEVDRILVQKLGFIVETENLHLLLDTIMAEKPNIIPMFQTQLTGAAKDKSNKSVRNQRDGLKTALTMNWKELDDFAVKNAMGFAAEHLTKFKDSLRYGSAGAKKVSRQLAMMAPKLAIIVRDKLDFDDEDMIAGETLEGSMETLLKKGGNAAQALQEKTDELKTLVQTVMPEDSPARTETTSLLFKHVHAKIAEATNYGSNAAGRVVELAKQLVDTHINEVRALSATVEGHLDKILSQDPIDSSKICQYVMNDPRSGELLEKWVDLKKGVSMHGKLISKLGLENDETVAIPSPTQEVDPGSPLVAIRKVIGSCVMLSAAFRTVKDC